MTRNPLAAGMLGLLMAAGVSLYVMSVLLENAYYRRIAGIMVLCFILAAAF